VIAFISMDASAGFLSASKEPYKQDVA